MFIKHVKIVAKLLKEPNMLISLRRTSGKIDVGDRIYDDDGGLDQTVVRIWYEHLKIKKHSVTNTSKLSSTPIKLNFPCSDRPKLTVVCSPASGLHRCWWLDVANNFWVSVTECRDNQLGNIFWMLMSDAYGKRWRILVTKTVKTVTSNSKLTQKHFVSNIRHQHRLCIARFLEYTLN